MKTLQRQLGDVKKEKESEIQVSLEKLSFLTLLVSTTFFEELFIGRCGLSFNLKPFKMLTNVFTWIKPAKKWNDCTSQRSVTRNEGQNKHGRKVHQERCWGKIFKPVAHSYLLW